MNCQKVYDTFCDARRLLYILVSTPYWNSVGYNLTGSHDEKLIYAKAISILQADELKPELQLSSRHLAKQQRRLPLRFRPVALERIFHRNEIDSIGSDHLYSRSQTDTFFTTSTTLIPSVGIESLRELIDFLSINHSESTQKHLLGGILLCLEVCKSLIQNASDPDIKADQINSAESCIWQLSFLLQGPLGSTISPPENDETELYSFSSPIHSVLNQEEPVLEEKSYLTPVIASSSLMKKSKRDFILDESILEDNFVENKDRNALFSRTDKQQMYLSSISLPKYEPIWDDTLEREVKKVAVEEMHVVQKSLISLKELTQQFALQTAEEIEKMERLNSTLNSTNISTQHATIDLAETSKSQANWWGVRTSGAGILSGSLLSIPLGPAGMIAGAGIGGAVGLAAGSSVRKRQIKKMDNIIKDMKQ